MGSREAENTGFAARLKELREQAGLSQQQLAEAAGLNVFGIAKLEQGQREPGWSTVLRIAAVLKVTPDAFIPVEEKSIGRKAKK